MDISISISNVTADDIAALARLFHAEKLPVALSEQAGEPAGKKRVGLAKDAGAIVLAPGAVDWTVEIDGVPIHWKLNYAAGNLPATRGSDIVWQGARYRISHIYGTSLKVTSQEAETYHVGANGVVAEMNA